MENKQYKWHRVTRKKGQEQGTALCSKGPHGQAGAAVISLKLPLPCTYEVPP